MERLCKCYDGDFWNVLKGTKGKRVGVTSAKLALLAFTTPQQFLESVWPKIVASKNGLAERLLFFYQRRSEDLDLEAMAENSDSLDEFSVKSLGDVFEKIYVEHNTTPALKYTLTATARKFSLSLASLMKMTARVQLPVQVFPQVQRNIKTLYVLL